MSGESATSLRVIILGTDALLEARPATPIQLARACLKAGFEFVAPVSWGEELLATHIIESVKDMAPPSSLIVHCPFVAEALRQQNEVLPMMWRAAAPPVVAARYVRAAFAPRPLHVTYAGHCPGASAPDLDDCVLPQVLFGRLLDAGADPEEQPKYFEEMIPPDRSRYASLPGGVPEPGLLHDAAGARLREAAAATLRAVALAFESSEPVVIDLEAASGCVCARDRFAASQLEPPRSPGPVVASGLDVDLAHYRTPREAALRRETTAPGEASVPSGAPPAAPLSTSVPPARQESRSSEPRRARPAVAVPPAPPAPSVDDRAQAVHEPPDQHPPADLVATLEPWLRKATPVRSVEPPISEAAAAPPPVHAADLVTPSEPTSPEPPLPEPTAPGEEGAAASSPARPTVPAESDAATQVEEAYPPLGDAVDTVERAERPSAWEQSLRRALVVLIALGALGGSGYAAYRAGWFGLGGRNAGGEPAPAAPVEEARSPTAGERPAAADSLLTDSLIPVATPRADTIPAADTLAPRSSIARGDTSSIY